MVQNYSYTTSQTNTFLFDTPKKTNILDGEHTDHLGNVRVTFKNIGSTEEPELATTSWTDYYPFGEAMPGRSLSGVEEPMYGYQGQERVGNGSKWYNFNLRMYNPSIGRFNTIDPYSQFHSPYLAMANNPISFVDPDGGQSVQASSKRNGARMRMVNRELRIMSAIAYDGGAGLPFLMMEAMGLTNTGGGSLGGGSNGGGNYKGGITNNAYGANSGIDEFNSAVFDTWKNGEGLKFVEAAKAVASVGNYTGNRRAFVNGDARAFIDGGSNFTYSNGDIGYRLERTNVNLPVFEIMAMGEPGLRLRKHLEDYSSGFNVDHYKTMNNPIVRAMHQGQSEFISKAWEVIEPLTYVTGAGAVEAVALKVIVKVAAKQAAKKALTTGVKQAPKLSKFVKSYSAPRIPGRAPAGGTRINGKFYKGGQLTPSPTPVSFGRGIEFTPKVLTPGVNPRYPAITNFGLYGKPATIGIGLGGAGLGAWYGYYQNVINK